LSIEGESTTLVNGHPQLPAITRNLIIPWNHEVSLEITTDNFIVRDLQAPPLAYNLTADSKESESTISIPQIYPPQPVMISEPKVFRGNQIVTVTYFPYQYNSTSGQYIHHENVEVSISYSPIDDSDQGDVHAPRTLTRDSYRMLRALTLNPPHRDDGGAILPLGGYLFIVGSGFDDEDDGETINLLADWKRSCGHHVDITWHAEHRSDVRRILEIIRTGYEEWDPPLEYVCIIGAFGVPRGPTTSYDDVRYGFLEGDDYTAEIAVGRICANTSSQLEMVITRILGYQLNPWLDELDWFEIAGHLGERVGGWMESVRRSVLWNAEASNRAGFGDVRTWVYPQDGANLSNQANQLLGSKANIVFHRGLGFGVNYQRNNYPIYLACGGGHVRNAWTNIWINGSMDNLRGPSAISGSTHNQGTIACNVILSSMAKALLLDKLPLGWARAFATANLEKGGVAQGYGIDYYLSDFGYYGDPSQLVWRGTPDQIEVNHQETIAVGSNRLVVDVVNINENVGVTNAMVTITEPGEILAYGYTNEVATCVFEIDPDWDEEIILTVTGEGILPYQTEIQIEEVDLNLGAFISSITEIDGGNENETINPGETVELGISIHNFGTEDIAREVSATILSTSPWVIIENGEIEFDEIRPGQDLESEDHPIFTIRPSTPEDANLNPLIIIQCENQEFSNFLPIEIEGSNLEFVDVIGGNIIEQDIVEFDVRVRNTGNLDSPEMQVSLVSESWMINVLESESNLDIIDPGETTNLNGDLFTINASTLTIPGSNVDMMLLVRTVEEEIPDTLRFQLQISEPGENTPFGPDGYGYICWDVTDRDWGLAPEYEWIEISTRDDDREFDGIPLPGNRVADFVHEIELPFDFQFYGQNFNTATISENGFIALGGNLQDHIGCVNFPLDRNIGGSFGMIAPYWDNLRITGNTANIYTYYDDEEHLFIIEWYRVPDFNRNTTNTFQIILFNPEFYPFESGDGMIKFQYRDIIEPHHGMAPGYFSTGICSPDTRHGINYVSFNEYPITSAPIGNRHAILFATDPYHVTGQLMGIVTDAETGDPIENAVVKTLYGQVGITDENGHWSIPNAWASEFSITAGKQGYNDSTLADLAIVEDEELEINFDLLHPELSPSLEEINVALNQDERQEFDFEIANTGNGSLFYNTEKHLRGGANRNPWELRQQMNLGQRLDEPRLYSAVLIENHFYLTGTNNREPQIYVLNLQGELVAQFPQFVNGGYGMKDLTWDGQLLWGGFENSIFGFTKEGELMVQFDGPINPNNNIAWDPDREVLWVSSTTSDIAGITQVGNEIESLGRCGLRIYGLAYYSDDEDNHPLYIFHKDRDIGDQLVTKMNPDTGDTLFVKALEGGGEGTPTGASITTDLDVYSWVFLAMINNGPNDHLDIWQVDSRKDWFNIDPPSGFINSEQSQEYVITVDTETLREQVRYEGDILFKHNADDGEFSLPVTLDVIGGMREISLNLHQGWNQTSINVTPDNLDVPTLLSQLVDEDILLLIKDGSGRFYFPAQGFCNIPNWNVAGGYLISVSEPCELVITGEVVQFDTPIDLHEGWNMSSYFPMQPTDVITALSGIRDQLTMAKDGSGNFYIPQFGFSNMGNLIEHQGYLYKVSEDVELIYQLEGDNELFQVIPTDPEHFSLKVGDKEIDALTNSNMSVLLIGEASSSGSEIGAFTESGKLIGSGCIDKTGRCGIAVWGDDPTTTEIDGADRGTQLKFRLWDGEKESDIYIKSISGEPIWSPDGLFIGELNEQSMMPLEFGINSTFPNPFNGQVQIEYAITEAGRTSLTILDISGREIAKLVNNFKPEGNFAVNWDAHSLPSGLYFAKLDQNSRTTSKKLMLVK